MQLRKSLSLARNRCQDNCFGPRSRFSRSGGIWWRHRPIPVKWGRPVGLAALHVSGSQTGQAILSKGELCLGGAPAAATQRGVRLHASNSAVDPNDQRVRRDGRTKTWNRAYARGSITSDLATAATPLARSLRSRIRVDDSSMSRRRQFADIPTRLRAARCSLDRPSLR